MGTAPKQFNPVRGRIVGTLSPVDSLRAKQAYKRMEQDDWYLSAIVDLLIDLQFPETLGEHAKGLAGIAYEALQAASHASPCSVRTIGRAAHRYVVEGKPLANDYGRLAAENPDIAVLTANLAAIWFPEDQQYHALGLAASIYWTLQNQEQSGGKQESST